MRSQGAIPYKRRTLHAAEVLPIAQAVGSANDPDREIGQQILDKDAGTRERAIQQIRAAENRPDDAAGALRRYWLAPMAKAGFNDGEHKRVGSL
jgi:hypothetical protein